MSDPKVKLVCFETPYKTAYDALFSPEGRALSRVPGAECKRCELCGKWHLRPNKWHPDAKDMPSA